MTDQGPTRGPEEHGLLRRGLFTHREPSPAEPTLSPTQELLAENLTRAVDEHLDEGVRTLETQATALLREVATEVWRTSARDVRPEQERIMTLLARDQAIRSLLASSDERFQALAMRTARLEDHLAELAESERRTREAMETTAASIRQIAESPTLHGVEAVRTQLEMVERHIAETFAHIDERDERLRATLLEQVREHGELVATETTRIVESMQAYVQDGAEAVGRLAQQIEEHAQLFVMQDHEIQEHVREIVADQTVDLTEQISLLAERVGLHGRDQEQLRLSVERLIEARIRGIAELVRADSQALQRLIEAQGSEPTLDEGAIASMLDDRTAALGAVMAERVGRLERTVEEQVLALSTAMGASVERGLGRLDDATGAIDGLDAMIAESQLAFEERVMEAVDGRVTALARLIRSDNQTLSRQMTELRKGSPEAGDASLEQRFVILADALHREGQSQAEALLKVAETLSDKIDRLSVRVDEGVGSDLQIVVDRMSDAIRAMSTVQRREAS